MNTTNFQIHHFVLLLHALTKDPVLVQVLPQVLEKVLAQHRVVIILSQHPD